MTKDVEKELQEQIEKQRRWERMSSEEKRRQLFQRQKETLEAFRVRHAISQAQYDRGIKEMTAALGAVF